MYLRIFKGNQKEEKIIIREEKKRNIILQVCLCGRSVL